MAWWDNSISGRRRAHALAALVAAMLAVVIPGAAGQDSAPATCAKSEFETVVDDAAAALRDLNAKNKPAFQDRLRQLKDKRGWSNDEFLNAAAPFVKDEQIEVFEKQSNDLLGKITSMGEAGSAAHTPDCGVLAELDTLMSLLVESQTAKWTYMFGKLDGELGR